MFQKRINIFTGHFGSGKSEVSVNYCIKMCAKFKVAIADLDIVNPYFRSTDAKSQMEEMGIWVVTPRFANTNVDVPALPPEINSMFEKKDFYAVFDVGGDDIGARALSRYYDKFIKEGYDMFFVINTKRPMTDNINKIENMIKEIEDSSRLKVTKLVNNTNLLEYTTLEDVMEGHRIIEMVSERLNIPIGFVSGFKEMIKGIEKNLSSEILFLDKFIKLPWN